MLVLVAAKVMSKSEHTYRDACLRLQYVRQTSIEGKGSPNSEELNQIEVCNIPRNMSERVLKRYFETAKANSCDKAVSDCTKVREGTFVVTFHYPKGSERFLNISLFTPVCFILQLQQM